MALLRVDSQGKPNILRVKLKGVTAKRLRIYSRFTDGGTQDSIIEAALNYVFDADKEFLQFEKEPANQNEEETRGRRKRASADINGSGAQPSANADASASKK